MFYPYEGYRSVTPLDAARVNRTLSDCKHIERLNTGTSVFFYKFYKKLKNVSCEYYHVNG